MTEPRSPIYKSSDDDTEMEQASAKARETFKYFWREMAWEQRRIIPGLDLAAVKASFIDPPELLDKKSGGFEVEHMWLTEVEFDGKQIQGTLINSPHTLKSIEQGDRVTVTNKQLFDWMYVIAGNVYGGFTVDLLRSRMGKGERRQHDKAWGFDFGEAGLVHLVPPEHIGEPPLKKKGLFSFFGGSKPTPQDYAKVAATEHPMSVNMRDSLDQAMTQNPEMIQQTDNRGYSFLHQLSLAGSWDGVDVSLKHGVDPKATAQNGMTRYALAKCLGWKRVMERLQKVGAT